MINLKQTSRLTNSGTYISVVVLLCLILFANYIFGGYVYIFTDIGSDTIDQYFPALYANSGLFQDSFSWYRFTMGVGSSTLLLNHYLFDPFSIFLYFLPKESLSSGLVYSIMLKIIFVAWFSYAYFRELFPDADEGFIRIGGLAVAFSGFFILWGQHYFLSSTFAWFPFLLYGFELLLKGKRKDIFILALALLALSLFAFYQVVFFFSVYALIRVFTCGRFENIKLRLLFIVKVLLPLSIVGIALVSFKVFPSFFELVNNPRISANGLNGRSFFTINTVEFIGNSFLRLFSNNFWGCGERYFGFLNYYESPQFFSTLLIPLLIPQLVFMKDKRLMVPLAILSLFVLLLFISPFLSSVLNGFQIPSYRWGMLANMSLVLLGLIGLRTYTKQVSRYKVPLLIVSAFVYVALMLVLAFRLKQTGFIVPIGKVILFFGCYVTVLILFARKHRLLYSALFLVLLVDIVVEHYPTINHRRAVKSNFEETGQFYFDGTKEVVDSISKRDTTFFRMIKSNYSRFLDDPLVQGYNGVTSYNSINDPGYVRFLQKTNVPFFLPNVVSYIGQFDNRPVLYDLLSVKYAITDTLRGNHNLVYADSVNQKYVYQRTNALPLGFTSDSYLLEENITHYSDSLLLKTIIIDHAPGIGISEIKSSAGVENLSITDCYSALRKDTLTITRFDGDHIKGTISLENNKLLFLSIPFDKGWTITCNGKKCKPLLANFGFMALPLSKGSYSIDMKFFPYPMKEGIVVSVITVLLILFFSLKRRFAR